MLRVSSCSQAGAWERGENQNFNCKVSIDNDFICFRQALFAAICLDRDGVIWYQSVLSESDVLHQDEKPSHERVRQKCLTRRIL